MTEDVIINLGFQRVVVPIEESGDETEFYYYDLRAGKISFITNASDELVDGQWVCYLFDCDVMISSEADMRDLIRIFKNNIDDKV